MSSLNFNLGERTVWTSCDTRSVEPKNIVFDWKEISNAVLDLLCSGFLVILNSSNKHHIRAAVLINFFVPNVALNQGWCLSSKYSMSNLYLCCHPQGMSKQDSHFKYNSLNFEPPAFQ